MQSVSHLLEKLDLFTIKKKVQIFDMRQTTEIIKCNKNDEITNE